MPERLSDLKNGERGRIERVVGHEGFRKRIAELGFVTGVEVESIRKAPFKDPGAYLVKGAHISLRNAEARNIEISLIIEGEENTGRAGEPRPSKISSQRFKIPSPGKKVIEVALVGNPNCGKTSIFNYASRSREKVANYSGVTVSMKEAYVSMDGYHFRLVDLPGTYSLSAHSPEEEYVREYLMKNKPDIVLNVLDSTRLERNLYLTTQLIDMNVTAVVALNMYDEFRNQKDYLKYDNLGKMLGIPFVPTI